MEGLTKHEKQVGFFVKIGGNLWNSSISLAQGLKYCVIYWDKKP